MFGFIATFLISAAFFFVLGFIDGFTNDLVGAKVGEKLNSYVTFPEKYGNADLAGKKTVFEFNVKAIYTELTPETITDAMVKEHFEKSYKG